MRPLQSPHSPLVWINDMFHIKSITQIKILITVLSLEGIKCSLDGSFTKHRQENDTKIGDDPCNPLYWYPRNIPEHCEFKNMPTPPTAPGPDLNIPLPIPVPVPPLPFPGPPIVPPIMMPPHIMPPGVRPPIAVPNPVMPLPIPLPFGIPLLPTNPMVPVAGIPLPPPPPPPRPVYSMPYPPQYPPPYPPPYPSPYSPPFQPPYLPPYPSPYPAPVPVPPRRGIGMIPGLPGIVSPDGGINIMPFSDAYADMLENHKQKMIRKRLQKMLNDYERMPWNTRRKTRRHSGREVIDEDNMEGNAIDS